MKKLFRSTYLAFIFLILYVPIGVLMLFSFNSGSSIRNFQGWGLEAYADLFTQYALWQSLSVTLLVAFISTIVAVIIGTFAALGLSRTNKLTRNMTLGITNIPLVNADIVTAVSLMLLFMAFAFNFGIATLILAHISFNIPYVIITVMPKIKTINPEQLEASQDLGASSWYTLRKVVFPTLKPAIIAGAAIAFAMSFDDFIISYFTGGNSANLSTYIYSLKRIKPYINAFSTIIIIIIAIIVISWNGYKITKKQVKARNEMIMNETYRDKRIIWIEKNLNKNYLLLNKTKVTKKRSKKNPLFHPVSESEEFYYQSYYENIINKDKWTVRNIVRLEKKLGKEQVWVHQVKKKIISKKRIKERNSRIRREKYHFLRWPWKLIAITVLFLGVFGGTLAYYIETNTYDLTVANWGEYISPEVLKGFEDEYHVKVKYTTYEDNETLYAKLATTDYDVMVPSDYLIAKLASEDRLLELDQSKLGNLGINTTLTTMMENYTFTINDGSEEGQEKNLTQYAVPYFWGDLILVFNTVQNPNLLTELGISNVDQANWDVLQTAIQQNKRVVLNNDMHNLFMLGLTTLHYENKWDGTPYENTGSGQYKQNGNTFNDYVNPQSHQQIDDVAQWLEPLIHSSNTRIQSDEIIDTIAKPSNNWDLAFVYNGDLLAAMTEDLADTNYAFSRPYMGTNVWNDDMVISKKTRNQELAYDFIKYIARTDVQVSLSEEFGYTSPVQAAIDQVSQLHPGTNWNNVYIPGATQIAPVLNPSQPAGFYNGLYRTTFDPYMQDQYNKLLSRQGSTNVAVLLIELAVALLIIIAFIAAMLWFR